MNGNIKKTLTLSLKKQWFEMTKSGIKTEDYREITPYWVKRLVEPNDEGVTVEAAMHYLNGGKQHAFYSDKFEFKKFDSNIMTLGYPKGTDTERILKLKHKGIEIRTGNPEWGAEPNKLYFVILHGSQIA